MVDTKSANGNNGMRQKADKAGGLSSSHKKDLELGQRNQANGIERKSSNSKPDLIPRNGYIRHVFAIVALSGIILANMNRQAYNQALVRMLKKRNTTENLAANQPDSTAANITSSSTPPPSLSTLPNIDGLDESSTFIIGEFADPIVGEMLEPDTHPSSDDSISRKEVPSDQDDGYDWTGSQIGILQAGFSFGYIVFMIPGGRMSEIYGSKWVLFVSGFGSALCSVLTPFIADTSYALLVASRVFMGLFQTGVSPALYAFCTRWLSPEEASVYLPLIKVGVMIGFMLGSLINGFLPWRTMFYVVGAVGFLWSLLWACFATSEPKDQTLLSKKELAYIEQALEQRRVQEAQTNGPQEKSSSAPWGSILSNKVVLAFTVTKFTVKLSTDTQTMQLPMYMRNVFQVSDSLNGILNGLNFALQATFTGLVAYTAKEMVVRKAFSLNKTGIRRIFQGINNFGMGLGYLLISFNMGSLELVCCAVVFLSISSMFGSGGEAVLPVDLSTEYAASIMAIANSLANLSGLVMPPVVSWLLANELTNPERWKRVWWVISATLICGGLVFTTFGKAKLQDFTGGKRAKSAKGNKAVKSNNTSQTDQNETWDTRL